MPEYKLGQIETKFAELIWRQEPVPSGELVKLCEKELQWKKSTTYTMLRRLCDRGIFQNREGIVTSLISQPEFYSQQSHQFVEETFGGSLPRFFAAFSHKNKLSEEEIQELEQMIRQYREAIKQDKEATR